MASNKQLVRRTSQNNVVPYSSQPDLFDDFVEESVGASVPVRLGIYRGVDLKQRPHMTMFIRTVDKRSPMVVMYYLKNGRVENIGMGFDNRPGAVRYDYPTFHPHAEKPEEVPFLMKNGSFQSPVTAKQLASIVAIIEDRPRSNIENDDWVREVGRELREKGWVCKDPKYGFPWEVPVGLGKPKAQPTYNPNLAGASDNSPQEGMYKIGVLQGYCRAGGLVLALFVESEVTGMPDVHTTYLIHKTNLIKHKYVFDIADSLDRHIPPEFDTVPRIFVLQRLRLGGGDRKSIKKICKEVGSRDIRSSVFVTKVLQKLEGNYLIRKEAPACNPRYPSCAEFVEAFPRKK